MGRVAADPFRKARISGPLLDGLVICPSCELRVRRYGSLVGARGMEGAGLFPQGWGYKEQWKALAVDSILSQYVAKSAVGGQQPQGNRISDYSKNLAKLKPAI